MPSSSLILSITVVIDRRMCRYSNVCFFDCQDSAPECWRISLAQLARPPFLIRQRVWRLGA
jgi:hypothetical protein